MEKGAKTGFTLEELDLLKGVVERLAEFITIYSLQIVGAFIVVFVGVLVARLFGHLLLRFLNKRKFDVTLSRFIVSALRFMIIGFALIVALGKFGVTIAPIVAALGALAFGASFAVQGPLSNFGAGLAIIFLRPFVVDDTIRVTGVEGVVEEVKLGYTTLRDEDGISIIVPNKEVVGQIIHNSGGRRLIEGCVGMSYGDAPEPAIELICDILRKDETVLNDPAPLVGLGCFADSAMELHFRYWVPTNEYFAASYRINQQVLAAFREHGISIPFPQQDVHLFREEQA